MNNDTNKYKAHFIGGTLGGQEREITLLGKDFVHVLDDGSAFIEETYNYQFMLVTNEKGENERMLFMQLKGMDNMSALVRLWRGYQHEKETL